MNAALSYLIEQKTNKPETVPDVTMNNDRNHDQNELKELKSRVDSQDIIIEEMKSEIWVLKASISSQNVYPELPQPTSASTPKPKRTIENKKIGIPVCTNLTFVNESMNNTQAFTLYTKKEEI